MIVVNVLIFFHYLNTIYSNVFSSDIGSICIDTTSMFQDYCALHGEPCIPGSLYCCEECWLEELSNSMKMKVSNCENREQLSTEKYILYECYKCNSSHDSHTSCEEAKLVKTRRDKHLNTSSYNWSSTKESRSADIISKTPRTCPVQVIQDKTSNCDDFSVLKGNQLIMSNYQVWLVNLNSGPL